MPKSRAQRRQDDFAGVEHRLLVDCRRHIRNRYVYGQRHHAQLVAGQHHHRAPRARQMGKKFGMAGKAEARTVQHRLVDGRGDHGCRFARHRGLHRDLNRFDHRRRIGGIQRAWHAVRARFGRDQRAGVRGENAGVTDQFERASADLAAEMIECGNSNLGPDTCGLAHGDQDWSCCALTG